MQTFVKERRKALGMTQQNLADASGISRMAICRIERGNCDGITARTMRKVASALGSDVTDLFKVNCNGKNEDSGGR